MLPNLAMPSLLPNSCITCEQARPGLLRALFQVCYFSTLLKIPILGAFHDLIT